MTLTLDDVRNMKFRMARRSGYEVMDVDQFVDQVEEAFAHLTEENQLLKQQVEALKSAASETSGRPAAPRPGDGGQSVDTGSQPAQSTGLPQAQSATSPTSGPATVGAQQAPVSATVSAPAAEGHGIERLVVSTSAEASQAAQRLVQMAERVVAEAEVDAEKIREDARREAHQITTDAKTRAERSESEARVNAERVSSDAKTRAEQFERELANKRTQMFGELEKQRDRLNESVEQLRAFEATYRSNLTEHLRRHIETLEGGVFEPTERPDGLAAPSADPATTADSGAPASGAGAATGQSATPRLDALLGDSR